jgi:aldehyde dehydrogenase (NAD+)
MKSYLMHYIDGLWVESDGKRHEVIDPATEQPCTEITLGTSADVDKAVAAARRAFESYSQTSVAERAALLGPISPPRSARKWARRSASPPPPRRRPGLAISWGR